MWSSSPSIPLLCKDSILAACCILLFWCTPATGQKSPPTETVERDALKLLNDSDWAHTVKPSLQDTPCTYQNPAFPRLYPEDKAAAVDATAPTTPPDPVRPDDSEYLIRFQSAMPVQTAIQELLAMGEKWAAYGTRKHQVREDDPSSRYNVADMITIAVILKQAGPDGTSMFNYGYEDNGRIFPSNGEKSFGGLILLRFSGSFSPIGCKNPRTQTVQTGAICRRETTLGPQRTARSFPK
jgi:hypothetical protein